MSDLNEVSDKTSTRCIICSDRTTKKQCYNVFNTTLQRGKVLLSDFVKNVLGCAVLIIVSPDFFVCKRCFGLCAELDDLLAHCNEIQETIQTLFKAGNSEELDYFETVTVSEIKRERLYEDEVSHYPGEDFHNGVKAVNKDNSYYSLEQDVVESEVTIADTTVIAGLEVYVPAQQDLYKGTQAVIKDRIDNNMQYSVEQGLVQDEITIAETTIIEEGEKILYLNERTGMIEENPPKETSQGAMDHSVQDPKNLEMWICAKCKINFDSEEFLQAHKKLNDCKETTLVAKSTFEFKDYYVKLKKKKKVFFCNICSYETQVSASMQKHLITHKTDPLFMCDVCGRRFKYIKSFEQHQQVHDESRPFPCGLCSFRAPTATSLKIHERSHDNHKKYFCSKCNYKTIKKMGFLIHSRTHTGERPYSCPNCPYRSKDPSTLLRHRKIHGGIKRYHCTVCDYKSVQKAALTIHLRSHTGEKPHACPHCDYRSSAKHNVASHIAAKHSDERPFACSECPYKTKNKRLLTYHMRGHSGEKPYACSMCNYRGRCRSGLTYHMKTRHPINGVSCIKRQRLITQCDMKRYGFQGEDVEFSDDADSGSGEEVIV